MSKKENREYPSKADYGIPEHLCAEPGSNIEPQLQNLSVSEPKKKAEVYLLVDPHFRSEINKLVNRVAVKKSFYARRVEVQVDELESLGKVAYTFHMNPRDVDKLRHVGVLSLECHKEYEIMTVPVGALPVGPLLDESIPLHGVGKIWDLGERGKNATLGILDTGYDPTHPDTEGAVIEARGFCKGNPAWKDGQGHGEFCLSIALGRGVASDGKYMGVAPEAKAYVGKCLSDQGKGYTADIIRNLDWFGEVKPHEVSMSLGALTYPTACKYKTSMSIATDNLCDMGINVNCASGNAGEDSICDPAQTTKGITVGACTKRDKIAYFTSRRLASEKCLYPDLPVPQIYGMGMEMIAARAKGTSMGSPIDEWYTLASGTSAATPVLAGFGLLLDSRYGRQPIDDRRLRLTRYAKEIYLT